MKWGVEQLTKRVGDRWGGRQITNLTRAYQLELPNNRKLRPDTILHVTLRKLPQSSIGRLMCISCLQERRSRGAHGARNA